MTVVPYGFGTELARRPEKMTERTYYCKMCGPIKDPKQCHVYIMEGVECRDVKIWWHRLKRFKAKRQGES